MNDIEQFVNIVNEMQSEFKMEMEYEKAKLIASKIKNEFGDKTRLNIQLMDDLKRSFFISEKAGKDHVKKVSPEWIKKQYEGLILDEYTQNGGLEWIGLTKFHFSTEKVYFEKTLEHELVMRIRRCFLKPFRQSKFVNGVMIELLSNPVQSYRALSNNMYEAAIDFLALRYKDKLIESMSFFNSALRDELVGRTPQTKFDRSI